MKDGYLLIDGSPWAVPQLDQIMKYVTLRMGHFEINYGDMHFRRSDNGEAMFNPLVGNLIMDAFTTEIGGEIYVRRSGLMAMGAVTGGEVRGQVLKPEQRSPSYMGKAGFDRQLTTPSTAAAAPDRATSTCSRTRTPPSRRRRGRAICSPASGSG